MLAPKLKSSEVILVILGLIVRKGRRRSGSTPSPYGSDQARRSMGSSISAPGGRQSLFIEVDCREPVLAPAPPRAFFTALRDSRRALRYAASKAASIQTSNHIFNKAARRSIADLYMLKTNFPEGPYPYAGIPWFSAIFGRDGIITALETLWLDPSIARGVLKRLAARCRPSTSIPSRTRSRAKSCTKRVMARWPRSEKCLSGATTAALTQRRSSLCSREPISSGPAT